MTYKVTIKDGVSEREVEVPKGYKLVFGIEKQNFSQRKGQWIWNYISVQEQKRDSQDSLHTLVSNRLWHMSDKEFDEIMEKRQ